MILLFFQCLSRPRSKNDFNRDVKIGKTVFACNIPIVFLKMRIEHLPYQLYLVYDHYSFVCKYIQLFIYNSSIYILLIYYLFIYFFCLYCIYIMCVSVRVFVESPPFE